MNSTRPVPQPVDLLHLTDTHVLADPGERLKGVDTFATLARVVAHAGAGGHGYRAVLVTGDIAGDDSAGAYPRFRQAMAPLGRPVYGIPGNHDDPALLRGHLPAGEVHVEPHLDLGPWRIVLLDSVEAGEVHGRLADAELRRLDSTLAGCAERFALVCLHHPPVSLGSAWMDRIGLLNADALWRVLDRHACVRGVLWGHAHQEFDRVRGGVRLLCTPSTWLQFRRGADEPEYDDLPPAYRVLRLGADGSLDTRVVWVPADTDVAQGSAMR